MIEKAVIDRFEGNKAVLFVGEPQRQVVVENKDLPLGANEGVWLLIELSSDNLISADIDEKETNRAKNRILDKLERLRKGEHLTN